MTIEKKLTLLEHLEQLEISVDRSRFQWLSSQVASKFKEKYPQETLKKVYRPNSRGKHVAIGYGYDNRVIQLIVEVLHSPPK